jgi:hypothetical protein
MRLQLLLTTGQRPCHLQVVDHLKQHTHLCAPQAPGSATGDILSSCVSWHGCAAMQNIY